VTSLTNQILS